MQLAIPATKIPATQMIMLMAAGLLLEKRAMGVSDLLMNIALTTSR